METDKTVPRCTTDNEDDFGREDTQTINYLKFVRTRSISDLVSVKRLYFLLVRLACLCVVISSITAPGVAQTIAGDQSSSTESVDTSPGALQAQLGESTRGSIEIEVGGYAQMNNSSSNTSGKKNQSNSRGHWGRMWNSYKKGVGNRITAIKRLAGGNVSGAQKAWKGSNKNFTQAGASAMAGVNKTKNDVINKTEDILPSGFGISLNIATGWYKLTRNRSKKMINDFGWMIGSLPAPGDAMKPGTWYPGFAAPINSSFINNSSNYTVSSNVSAMGSVTGRTKPILPGWISLNKWWNSAWKLYAGLSALVTAPLLVFGIFAWAKPGRARERAKRLRDVATAFLLVLLGVVLMPGLLHGSNLLVTGIIPGGDELLRTPGNIAKLGLGALWINAATVIVSLITGFIQWLATFFLASLWPVYSALWASSSQTAKAYSKLGFSMLGFLIALKFLQAVWLRFIFNLPLDFGAPVVSFVTLIVTILGLGIGFVVMPLYAATKVVPSFVVNIVKTPVKAGSKYMIYK
jgi:hypothetical protein